MEFRKIFKKITSAPYKYKETEELPQKIAGKVVYIIVEDGQKLHAVLQCPCGCKDLIYLNLLKDTWPYWAIKPNKKSIVTISPSVWRTVGCKSHFFIRNGKILWACEDDD